MDLAELTAEEAAAHLRAGDFRALDYFRALSGALARAAESGALVDPDREPERAIERARDRILAADASRLRGGPPGRLCGVPVAVKDNIDLAGERTSAGTPALRDHIAPSTAPILSALAAEGAIPIAKTNMDELALGVAGDNAWLGPVKNPYDPARSPGGSSAGSAALVAMRAAPIALGTDTGGSIRIPAAHCGVVGFRPSTGRYPAAGIVPMNWSRDVAGPLARSVGDVALIDEILTGERLPEPGPLSAYRIGVPRAGFAGDLDPAVGACADAELARLERLGATLAEVDLADFAECFDDITGPLTAWELPRDLEDYLRRAASSVTVDELAADIACPRIREQVAGLLAVRGHPGLRALYERITREVIPDLRRAYTRRLREVGADAVAYPTSPIEPGPVGAEEWTNARGRRVSAWESQRNALLATLVGAPAVSVPAGVTPSGAPVGMELCGIPGEDRAILSLALARERTAGPLRPPDPRSP